MPITINGTTYSEATASTYTSSTALQHVYANNTATTRCDEVGVLRVTHNGISDVVYTKPVSLKVSGDRSARNAYLKYYISETENPTRQSLIGQNLAFHSSTTQNYIVPTGNRHEYLLGCGDVVNVGRKVHPDGDGELEFDADTVPVVSGDFAVDCKVDLNDLHVEIPMDYLYASMKVRTFEFTKGTTGPSRNPFTDEDITFISNSSQFYGNYEANKRSTFAALSRKCYTDDRITFVGEKRTSYPAYTDAITLATGNLFVNSTNTNYNYYPALTYTNNSPNVGDAIAMKNDDSSHLYILNSAISANSSATLDYTHTLLGSYGNKLSIYGRRVDNVTVCYCTIPSKKCKNNTWYMTMNGATKHWYGDCLNYKVYDVSLTGRRPSGGKYSIVYEQRSEQALSLVSNYTLYVPWVRFYQYAGSTSSALPGPNVAGITFKATSTGNTWSDSNYITGCTFYNSNNFPVKIGVGRSTASVTSATTGMSMTLSKDYVAAGVEKTLVVASDFSRTTSPIFSSQDHMNNCCIGVKAESGPYCVAYASSSYYRPVFLQYKAYRNTYDDEGYTTEWWIYIKAALSLSGCYIRVREIYDSGSTGNWQRPWGTGTITISTSGLQYCIESIGDEDYTAKKYEIQISRNSSFLKTPGAAYSTFMYTAEVTSN